MCNLCFITKTPLCPLRIYRMITTGTINASWLRWYKIASNGEKWLPNGGKTMMNKLKIQSTIKCALTEGSNWVTGE